VPLCSSFLFAFVKCPRTRHESALCTGESEDLPATSVSKGPLETSVSKGPPETSVSEGLSSHDPHLGLEVQSAQIPEGWDAVMV
jgi:hypothetical protein